MIPDCLLTALGEWVVSGFWQFLLGYFDSSFLAILTALYWLFWQFLFGYFDSSLLAILTVFIWRGFQWLLGLRVFIWVFLTVLTWLFWQFFIGYFDSSFLAILTVLIWIFWQFFLGYFDSSVKHITYNVSLQTAAKTTPNYPTSSASQLLHSDNPIPLKKPGQFAVKITQ